MRLNEVKKLQAAVEWLLFESKKTASRVRDEYWWVMFAEHTNTLSSLLSEILVENEELREESDLLSALKECGVEDWEGYQKALEL